MKIIIFCAALALVGCGDASEKAGGTEAVEEAADVIGETYHESLDAAEAVEDEVMKAKENIDAAMQEAEGK